MLRRRHPTAHLTREQLTDQLTSGDAFGGKDGPRITLVKPLHDALAPDERMAPWFRKLLACAIAEASKYVAPEPAPLRPEPPPLAPLAPLPPVVGWDHHGHSRADAARANLR